MLKLLTSKRIQKSDCIKDCDLWQFSDYCTAVSTNTPQDFGFYKNNKITMIDSIHAIDFLNCLPSFCAESRTTSRTFAKKEEEHIEQLEEAAASPEVAKLFEMFMNDYKKVGNLFQRHD